MKWDLAQAIYALSLSGSVAACLAMAARIIVYRHVQKAPWYTVGYVLFTCGFLILTAMYDVAIFWWPEQKFVRWLVMISGAFGIGSAIFMSQPLLFELEKWRERNRLVRDYRELLRTVGSRVQLGAHVPTEQEKQAGRDSGGSAEVGKGVGHDSDDDDSRPNDRVHGSGHGREQAQKPGDS